MCVRTGDQTQDPSIHDAGNCSLFFREIKSRYEEALRVMSGTYCFIHALCQPCLSQCLPHALCYRGTEMGWVWCGACEGLWDTSRSQGIHTRVFSTGLCINLGLRSQFGRASVGTGCGEGYGIGLPSSILSCHGSDHMLKEPDTELQHPRNCNSYECWKGLHYFGFILNLF